MIAKAVTRRSATSGYDRLAAYITDRAKLTADETFGRTAAYITRLDDTGGRAVGVRLTNCCAEDLEAALHEIQVTQALNTRSRADKTYHLVFSFPEGERPSPDVLAQIEQALCDAIGLGDHQRISAVHDDTPYLHVHLAINKVHPETLRCVSPHRDHPRLMAACRALEQAHGLMPTPHGFGADRKPAGARDMENQAQRESLAEWLRPRTAQLVAEVAEAPDWQAVHVAFARLGLELKPRGSGLVVAAGKVRLKASAVDRTLSMKALSARLGPYVAPGPQVGSGTPVDRYVAWPRHDAAPGAAAAGPAGELFRRYQADRAAQEQSRLRGLKGVRAEWDAYGLELKAYHQRRAAALREAPTWSRRLEWARLRSEKQLDWVTAREGRSKALAEVRARLPVKDWRSWLEAAAGQGDEDALDQLRRQDRTRGRAAAAVLAAGDASAARRVVYTDLAPRADRRGHLHYRLKDGGLMIDSGRAVEVTRASASAAYLALSLSGERHPGRPIAVEGGAAFKAELARIAALPGLDTRFADAAMEGLRLAALASGGAARPPQDGVEAYIAERNALRDQVPGVAPHRAWTASDAGAVAYAGRRTAPDGGTMLLWRTEHEVLVQRCSAAQHRLAGTFTVGDKVDISSNGRWRRDDGGRPAGAPAL